MSFQDTGQRQDQPPSGTIDPGPPGTVNPPALPPRSRAQNALFIPNAPNQDADQWGKPNWAVTASTMYPGPDRGPYMPSVPESYSTLASSAGQLARWSSPDVSASASRVSQDALSFAPLLDMLSRGAFSKGFNQGSLAAIKRRQQQMLLDAEETRQKHENMMLEFAQVYNAYDSIGEHGEHSIDKEEARTRILDLAKQHNWDALENIIEFHGIEAGRDFLKKQHADYLNMISGATALKKATGADEDAETATEWGEEHKSAVGGGGGLFSGGTSGASREASETTESPRSPETPSSGEFNTGLAKGLHLTPAEMQAAQIQVDTGKPSDAMAALEKKKDNPARDMVIGKTGRAVDAINSHIDQTINDPNMTYDDKMKEIAKTNPGVARHLSGLLALDLDPKETAVPNRGAMARRAEEISKSKGSPGKFTQANYENAKRFSDTRAVENKVLVRTNDLVQNWKTLLRSLKEIGENKSIPREQVEAGMAGRLTGDHEYDVVFSQIRNIATQINSIQTLTGTPRVTMVHDITTNLQKDASPRSIRAQLLPDLQDAFAIVNSYQDQWEALGKQSLVPAMSAKTFKDYNAIVRMNPLTGEVPEDASFEMKAAGQDPSKASTRLTSAQRLSPLTLDQIRQLRAKVTLWEHSTDPNLRAKAQDYRERVGPIDNIERHIPGVTDENDNATQRR